MEEKSEIVKGPKNTASEANPSTAVEKKDSGYDLAGVTGTIATYLGGFAMFTGAVFVSVIVLNAILPTLGLWAIPVLMGAGFAFAALGDYLNSKSEGSSKPNLFSRTAQVA